VLQVSGAESADLACDTSVNKEKSGSKSANSAPSKVDYFRKRERPAEDREPDRISKLHAIFLRGAVRGGKKSATTRRK